LEAQSASAYQISFKSDDLRLRKIHTKSYISHLCPEVHRERIFTKFGTIVPLVDIINPGKLCVNLFKGFDFTGGQSFHFSRRKLTSPL